MILNVQVLRGLAALAVVLFHTQFTIYNNVHTDFQAVSVFFVLSGFIMTYIIKNGEERFLLHRLIRIVPLYWIATVASFLINCSPLVLIKITLKSIYNGDFSILKLLAQYKNVVPLHDVPFLIKSLLFIPYPWGPTKNNFPYLGVGWTLNHEMFFYLLLSVTLMLNRKWAAVFSGLILIGLKFIAPSLFYSASWTTFFILGILAYYVWVYIRDLNVMKKKLFIFPVGVFTVSCFLVLNGMGLLTNVYLRYFMPFGLVIVALLFHSAGIRCTWKPLLILGNASYSLYLIHSLWLPIQMRLSSYSPIFNYQENLIGLFIGLAISALLAIVIHYKIENPIIRKLRFKLLGEGSRNNTVLSTKQQIAR